VLKRERGRGPERAGPSAAGAGGWGGRAMISASPRDPARVPPPRDLPPPPPARAPRPQVLRDPWGSYSPVGQSPPPPNPSPGPRTGRNNVGASHV